MDARGLAHRGYPGRYPENTLTGFQAACELGFAYLELDVQLSKDGVPVVMHDFRVDRVTDGKGNVKDMTIAELKRLRIAGTEEIPTLEEALRLLQGRILVDVELKQCGDLYPGLEAAVLGVVHKLNMEDQVFFTSFDHYSMIRMRELHRGAEIGLINYGASPALIRLAKELNGRYVSVRHNYLTEPFIRLCEEEGIQLIAWTVDEESDMRRMAGYPSVLVCTNELERWQSVAGA